MYGIIVGSFWELSFEITSASTWLWVSIGSEFWTSETIFGCVYVEVPSETVRGVGDWIGDALDMSLVTTTEGPDRFIGSSIDVSPISPETFLIESW